MRTFYKLLLAGLFSCSLLTATARPVNDGEDAVAGATAEAKNVMPPHEVHGGCHGMGPVGHHEPIYYQSCKMLEVSPFDGSFLVIDSVECCVHLNKMQGDTFAIVATFQTDNIKKRHDLKQILRPVSIDAMDDYFVVLASAVNDTAYVVILDEELNEVARRTFSSPMYAINIMPGVMKVVGRNAYGYDFNIIPLGDKEGGFDKEVFEKGTIVSQHYRVAKQAEKIQDSDPVGIGLTAVAVGVVFLALVCIALILQGTGKLMSGMEDKKKSGDKKKGGAAVQASAAAADKEDEIYAAIAAAIHLYNDELHDEEDTVITIQKVEREWTPWNAKYYNMNQYFNNRR